MNDILKTKETSYNLLKKCTSEEVEKLKKVELIFKMFFFKKIYYFSEIFLVDE